MTFTDSVKTCLSKYIDFSGRATRSEYWWFLLAYYAVYLAFIMLFVVTELSLFAVIAMILSFALLVPSIAVGVRRMHDVDKKGWWLLVPFVNLYFSVIPGTPGDNRFGAPPSS